MKGSNGNERVLKPIKISDLVVDFRMPGESDEQLKRRIRRALDNASGGERVESQKDLTKIVSVKSNIKPMPNRICLSCVGARHAGEDRHPEAVLRGMGVTYESSNQYLSEDCWIFHGVCLGSKEPPSYIHVIKENDETCYEEAK